MTGDRDSRRRWRRDLHQMLLGLAPFYRDLRVAATDRIRPAPKVRHRSFPMAGTTVYEFLYNPDHLGRAGMVETLVASENITRLALGHPTPQRRYGPEQVPHSVGYLDAQLDLVLDARHWTGAAENAVTVLGDRVRDRIDFDRVKQDYDLWRRYAQRRLAELDQLHERTDPGLTGAERAELEAMMAEDYVDYEGRLRVEIEARYRDAAKSADGWAVHLAAEIGRFAGQAAALLGVAQHAAQGPDACPWCSFAIGLSRYDPDLATCSGCGRNWGISEAATAAASSGTYETSG